MTYLIKENNLDDSRAKIVERILKTQENFEKISRFFVVDINKHFADKLVHRASFFNESLCYIFSGRKALEKELELVL